MSDDLDDLKSAFGAATPAPDAARRADNIALAQKNFEAVQGSREAARPTPVTAPKGLWTGIVAMMNAMTTKGGMTATTAIVACGFLFVTPVGQGMWRESTPQLSADVRADMPAQVAPDVNDRAKVEAIPAPEPTLAAPAPASRAASPERVQTEARLPSNIQSEDEVTVSEDLDFSAAAAIDHQAPFALPQEENGTAESDYVLTLDAGSTILNFFDRESNTEDRWISPNDRREPNTLFEAAPFPSERAGSADAAGFERSANTETFANEEPSPLKITQEDPVSTFSIDVDTASYSVLRSSLSHGQLPPPNAIRIEELINYFPYNYPAPNAGEAPFRPTVSAVQTPWNADTQLVHIAIQGQMPAIADRPPLNLVFLIDTSGSMNDPEKLPLLKQSFRLMLSQLRPKDEVAIVAYAGSAGQVLAATPASEQEAIINAINNLGAGGSTNGQGGLQQAYAVADQMAADGEVSRVILATDGDFNVGIHNPDTLKDFIAKKRDTGTYLSVLGFGRGNLDDATMQALAQNGNGTAAYIDTLAEAQKVLVDQLTGALFPIAGDVKIQVEWNPAEIAEYRLIGYETRALAREDFNDDKVDAGELGAGHSVTAIYEVTPVGSPAQLSDPLRYAPVQAAESNGELGFLKLRYKEPGADDSILLTTPITPAAGASSEAQFAVAIAGFGQLLRDDRYLDEWSFADAIALANANRGADEFGYRTEAVQLMRLAESLSRNPQTNGVAR